MLVASKANTRTFSVGNQWVSLSKLLLAAKGLNLSTGKFTFTKEGHVKEAELIANLESFTLHFIWASNHTAPFEIRVGKEGLPLFRVFSAKNHSANQCISVDAIESILDAAIAENKDVFSGVFGHQVAKENLENLAKKLSQKRVKALGELPSRKNELLEASKVLSTLGALRNRRELGRAVWQCISGKETA